MNNTFDNFNLIAVPDLAQVQNLGKGAHEKGLIIFWESALVETQDLEQFLSKILTAVQFNLQNDAFLIQLKPNQKIPFTSINHLKPNQYLISFGIEPNRLGLHFTFLKYQNFKHQTIKYLFADDLQAIFEERQRGEKQMSAALWKALKRLFEIS